MAAASKAQPGSGWGANLKAAQREQQSAAPVQSEGTAGGAADALAASMGAVHLAPEAGPALDDSWQAAAAQQLGLAHPWAGGTLSLTQTLTFLMPTLTLIPSVNPDPRSAFLQLLISFPAFWDLRSRLPW